MGPKPIVINGVIHGQLGIFHPDFQWRYYFTLQKNPTGFSGGQLYRDMPGEPQGTHEVEVGNFNPSSCASGVDVAGGVVDAS